jgi:hypothetical protein
MMQNKATMTEAEFARAVGLSRVTIWRLRTQGLVPHYKIGARILYDQKHIELFLKTYETGGLNITENLKGANT